MAELKTKKTKQSVKGFLESIRDDVRRADAFELLDMMTKITKEEPRMWGTAIVGFGDVHLVYESGRELDWFRAGFSPRKDALTLYLLSGIDPFPDLLAKLGPYERGKGCLYLKSLDAVHKPTLKKLIAASLARARKMHAAS